MKKNQLLFVLGCLITFSVPAYADQESEREILSKIAYELDRLQEIAIDTGKSSTEATRVKFRYDWLARDLELIKQGIEMHMQSPRQPREIKPLSGDYRR